METDNQTGRGRSQKTRREPKRKQRRRKQRCTESMQNLLATGHKAETTDHKPTANQCTQWPYHKLFEKRAKKRTESNIH